MGPHAAKFSVKLLMFLLTCYFGLDACIGKPNTKGKIGFSNVRHTNSSYQCTPLLMHLPTSPLSSAAWPLGRGRHNRASLSFVDYYRLSAGANSVVPHDVPRHNTQSHTWHQLAASPLSSSRRCSTATPHSQINRGWQCYCNR